MGIGGASREVRIPRYTLKSINCRTEVFFHLHFPPISRPANKPNIYNKACSHWADLHVSVISISPFKLQMMDNSSKRRRVGCSLLHVNSTLELLASFQRFRNRHIKHQLLSLWLCCCWCCFWSSISLSLFPPIGVSRWKQHRMQPLRMCVCVASFFFPTPTGSN